ncbi:hypothetical protein DQ238_12805 [Geodermatophilus sp. TF02-6]|uniref:hypothetical protein n=1 Tax=Geodermatophilus sp. TF02-6 TaxID=2250575 RepID=UPI000DEBE1A5|nr:hypothetical protein [Geodermatophilus sp. TF02-6]RBY78343.1 hypothetical protein DQ238_12805 [Geodermatophilus sp. TF02-6]
MESNDLTDPAAAAADLTALRDAREALIERVQPPWWYSPATGVVVFLLLGSISLHGVGPWQFVASGLGLALLWWLVAAYKRSTGVWVSGFRPGRTRRTIRVWVAGYAVVVALAALAEFGFGWRGAMAVAGAVLGVVLHFINDWWMRVYAAELREQP